MLTIKMILVFVLVFIAWMAVEIVINRLIPWVKQGCAAIRNSQTVEKDLDPFEEIDGETFNIDKALLELRLAVAHNIATERQLEAQLEKNNSQAATWENRAATAVEQNNHSLAKQALERKEEYRKAAARIRIQLEKNSRNHKAVAATTERYRG